MAANATLEELRAVSEDLNRFREEHPASFTACADLLKKHRKVGYKNICKMLLGEATPEKLKES